MPSQTEESSTGKRKASKDEDSAQTPGSPASKKLKVSPKSISAPADKANTPKSANSTADAKPKSATAAALSSIPKAKRAPGENAPPPVKQSRRTPPRRNDAPAPIYRELSRSPPRQRRRPGRQLPPGKDPTVQRREAERRPDPVAPVFGGNIDVVRDSYNAIPERGRDWRVTESKIKGLRNFNNWVKSAVIQKFAAAEDVNPGDRLYGRMARNGLRVLDIGCGKGGDLQKWQNAPCQVDLYIGLDPADQSIGNAKDRYSKMPPRSRGRPLFNAHFYAKDCFRDWVGDVQTIRQVGIDPNPGQGMSMPGSGGGFDIVTMMFSLHYAFEDERSAKVMLRNVAGALKKGGRFIGVIPNSDVIQAKLKETWRQRQREDEGLGATPKPPPREDGEIDEDLTDADGSVWDPEKMIDALPHIDSRADLSGEDTPNGVASPSPMHNGHLTPLSNSSLTLPPPTREVYWKNSLYRVDFMFPPAAPHFTFRPKSFGWKYFYSLQEAVNAPEFVVPWEALRALASDFDLELRWMKTFEEVWEEERDDPELGPLSKRMGVKDERGGRAMGDEEMEAANFYLAFCFYKA